MEECRLKVFENRVLRRIYGTKRGEVTGVLEKVHNEEQRNSCSLPSIIRMIKSRRMIWARHVSQIGRREMHKGYWLEKQKERDH
jgi:hypothetical protein